MKQYLLALIDIKERVLSLIAPQFYSPGSFLHFLASRFPVHLESEEVYKD
jgi:hypothetical protein